MNHTTHLQCNSSPQINSFEKKIYKTTRMTVYTCFQDCITKTNAVILMNSVVLNRHLSNLVSLYTFQLRPKIRVNARRSKGNRLAF